MKITKGRKEDERQRFFASDEQKSQRPPETAGAKISGREPVRVRPRNPNQFDKKRYSVGTDLSENLWPFGALRIIMESLILAQNERWRRVLSMQVERDSCACT